MRKESHSMPLGVSSRWEIPDDCRAGLEEMCECTNTPNVGIFLSQLSHKNNLREGGGRGSPYV